MARNSCCILSTETVSDVLETTKTSPQNPTKSTRKLKNFRFTMGRKITTLIIIQKIINANISEKAASRTATSKRNF